MKWLRSALFVAIPLTFVFTLSVRVATVSPTEAPTGFDGLTNGVADQATHDGDRIVFAEQETIDDGLGPVYNAQSCGECHQNPITGGNSQIVEQRAGHLVNGVFFDHPGDSLIHSRGSMPASRNAFFRTTRCGHSVPPWGYSVMDSWKPLPTPRFNRSPMDNRREASG